MKYLIHKKIGKDCQNREKVLTNFIYPFLGYFVSKLTIAKMRRFERI